MTKTSRRPVSALRSHIGYQLRAVSNAVSVSFARRVAATGVTVAEWVILREMYSLDETTSPGAVAESTGLSKGAISRLVARLLQKGLVTSAQSSGDRRSQEIALTVKAVKLVPRLAAIADENDEAFFSLLTARERRSLVALMMKLAAFHKLATTPIE